MSYAGYVAGAYAVFAAFLAWDFVVPRWRLARAKREIGRRAARDVARAAASDGASAR